MAGNSELKFTVVEEIAVLSEAGNWNKELNIVKWGDNEPKYDIRTWNNGRTRAGKGITLSLEEIKELKKALNSLDV